MSIVKPQEFEKSLLRACAQEIIVAFKDGDCVITAIYGLCVDGDLEIFLGRKAESDAVDLAQRMAFEVAKSIDVYVDAIEGYDPAISKSLSGFLPTKNDFFEHFKMSYANVSKLDRAMMYISSAQDYTEYVMQAFEAEEKARISKSPIEIYEDQAQTETYPLFDHPQTIGLAYARQFIVTKISFLYARAGVSPSEEVGQAVDEERKDFLELLFHQACGGDLEKPNHPIAFTLDVLPKGLIH